MLVLLRKKRDGAKAEKKLLVHSCISGPQILYLLVSFADYSCFLSHDYIELFPNIEHVMCIVSIFYTCAAQRTIL